VQSGDSIINKESIIERIPRNFSGDFFGVYLAQILQLKSTAAYKSLTANTKLNFILGQCSKAEIQAGPLWRWLLVNTGWTNYKIQSV